MALRHSYTDTSDLFVVEEASELLYLKLTRMVKHSCFARIYYAIDFLTLHWVLSEKMESTAT
jgi:hypothetical protein